MCGPAVSRLCLLASVLFLYSFSVSLQKKTENPRPTHSYLCWAAAVFFTESESDDQKVIRCAWPSLALVCVGCLYTATDPAKLQSRFSTRLSYSGCCSSLVTTSNKQIYQVQYIYIYTYWKEKKKEVIFICICNLKSSGNVKLSKAVTMCNALQVYGNRSVFHSNMAAERSPHIWQFWEVIQHFISMAVELETTTKTW